MRNNKHFRPTKAIIDLDAIKYNVLQLKNISNLM